MDCSETQKSTSSKSFTYLGRKFTNQNHDDDDEGDSSYAFSDCNSDRSGEFQTTSSQSRRLFLACASDNELISQLVADLQSNAVEVQKQAAMELRLLAKNKPDNRIKIARAGAIRPLIAVISSGDPQLQEYGVTAILNLSLCDENKEEIARCGAIKPLVRALRIGTSTAKENAACALLRLSQIEENKIAIGRSGAIQPLVNLLENGRFRGQKDACTALYSLCSARENKVRAVEAGIIKPLVEKMADLGSNMVDKSAFVMSLLVSVSEARAALPISDLPLSRRIDFPNYPQSIPLFSVLNHSPSFNSSRATSSSYSSWVRRLTAVTERFVEPLTSSEDSSQDSDNAPEKSSSTKLVLVVGGTGGVGQLVVASLLDRGIKSRLLLRNPEKATALFGEQDEEKLQVRQGDTRNPGDLDPSIFEGVTHVICCTGTTAFPSKRWDGDNTPEKVDWEGVRNLVSALPSTLKRIILVSSVGVTKFNELPWSIMNLFGVLKYKKMGEDFVRNSGLPYTIIRPGRLTDGPYTSYDLNTLLQATAGERRAVVIDQGDKLVGEVSRLVIAEACIQALDIDFTQGQIYEINSVKGEGPGSDPQQWRELFKAAQKL